jgi:hypothetical protein
LGECIRTDAAVQLGRFGIGVHAHSAQVGAEVGLHVAARSGVQWVPLPCALVERGLKRWAGLETFGVAASLFALQGRLTQLFLVQLDVARLGVHRMALNEGRNRAGRWLALETAVSARPSARRPRRRGRIADHGPGHAVGFTFVGVIGRPDGQLGLHAGLSEQALDSPVAGCALELEDAGRRGPLRLLEGRIDEPGFRAVRVG